MQKSWFREKMEIFFQFKKMRFEFHLELDYLKRPFKLFKNKKEYTSILCNLRCMFENTMYFVLK